MASSSKNVKFEISLEKLTVKFEGDLQVAEQMHREVTSALTSLASAQSRMLGPTPATSAPAQTPAIDVTPVRRRRRRRAGTATAGIDPAILEGVDANGDAGDAEGDAETRKVPRPGSGGTALVTALKAENFFSAKRTIAAIRDALAQKGHSYKSNEISPTLVSLTQQGVLQREKNTQGQWIYFAQ